MFLVRACFRPAVIACAVLFVGTTLAAACGATAAPAGGILVLRARGDINSVMAEYLSRGIDDAQHQHASAVVVELDTPGGLDSSMRQIIQRMNASAVPVIVYVFPAGARAASAGTFITEASALAAMAPGTNIGAASPVAAGGADIGGTEGTKITNDAVAFIRSLAQEHGRDPDWAESAVRKASALPASEAVEQHVVELVAPDIPSLLQQADGRTVRAASSDTVLHTAGLPVYTRDQSVAERLLDLISDPNIAFLLFTLGGLALAFEVIHPTLFTGIFGIIVLVTGLFALGTLPTNWAAAALILVAFVLFVVDVYTGGIGILAAGGVTALVLGGLLLVGGSGAPGGVSRWLVFGVPLLLGVLFVGGISALYRTRRRPSVVGEQSLIGQSAVVRSRLDPSGYVMVAGEHWRATLPDGFAEPGETVTVVAVRGLELDVRGVAPPEHSLRGKVAEKPLKPA
jgi:membrane-bound serine protease (ClpP class)